MNEMKALVDSLDAVYDALSRKKSEHQDGESVAAETGEQDQLEGLKSGQPETAATERE